MLQFFAKSPLRLGRLYISASAVQCAWPYLIYQNWEEARGFLHIPILGWSLALIWVGMCWVIPHLFYIGNALVRSARRTTLVEQSPHQKNLATNTVLVLMAGIVMDLILLPTVLAYITDPGWIIMLSGLMGGRVLMANMEAIFAYYYKP
ncbi:MAG: hypothetical protein RLZZ26_562 [Candidatus Parcubacteria bacterium]|jgi:hypothetical protein